MRTKNAILNFISDVIPQLILAIIGLVKAYYFIAVLGTDTNGLYNNYSQIMTYLALADGGLASAILYKLYKPIAEKDDNKISAILAGSKIIFRIIALIIFVLGVAVSFVIPCIIKDNPFEYTYVQFTFIIYLVSSLFTYFTITNQTIFEAYQRKYVTNLVVQIITIVKSILEILIINIGLGLIGILILLAISNFVTCVIIYVISKKSYKNIDFKSKTKDYSILKDVKPLMIHKIGGIIAYNIDIVILTAVKGLTTAAIYSQYLYIINSITTMLYKFTLSITAGIGEVIVKSKEKSYEIFKEINSMCFFMATVIAIPLVLVLNSFIQIWHEGRIETALSVAILFVLNLFYFTIRMPLQTYSNSAGLFNETKICPIIECVVNLGLSIILVNVMGIPGVLLATFIAYIVSDYLIRPRIIYKKIFDLSASKYYIKNVIYIGIALVSFFVTYMLFRNVPNTNYLEWFIYSGVLFIFNFILTMLLYIITKQAIFMDRFKVMYRKIFKKEV